jgi:hypothetical protein
LNLIKKEKDIFKGMIFNNFPINLGGLGYNFIIEKNIN